MPKIKNINQLSLFDQPKPMGGELRLTPYIDLLREQVIRDYKTLLELDDDNFQREFFEDRIVNYQKAIDRLEQKS